MDQRGAGRAGCFLVLVIFVAIIFLAIKVAPVYLDKTDFEDEIGRLAAKAGAANWAADFLKKQVQETARGKEFETTEDEIEVSKTNPYGGIPEIKVKIRYRRSVDIAGYVHTFVFDSTVSSFVGAL